MSSPRVAREHRSFPVKQRLLMAFVAVRESPAWIATVLRRTMVSGRIRPTARKPRTWSTSRSTGWAPRLHLAALRCITPSAELQVVSASRDCIGRPLKTFNPKVAGSIPARPIRKLRASEPNPPVRDHCVEKGATDGEQEPSESGHSHGVPGVGNSAAAAAEVGVTPEAPRRPAITRHG